MRVGIVGLSASGGWASTAHVPAIAACAGVELVGLATSSSASARNAQDQFGVRGHASVADLVARDDIDLIVVAVKVTDHRTLVSEVIAAGRNVYCEWPLGRNTEEARDVRDSAEIAGVRTFIGLQARSSPTLHWIRELVVEGYVGRVVSSNVIGTGLLGANTIRRRGLYQLDVNNGATVLTIPFAHTLDAVQQTLGGLRTVSAHLLRSAPQVTVDDTQECVDTSSENQVVVAGELAGGGLLTMHYRGGVSAGHDFRWEINGTEGELVITGDAGNIQMATLEVRGARRGAAELRLLNPPKGHAVTGSGLAGSLAAAYRAVRADFLEGSRVSPTFDDAVRLHELLDVIRESAASGRRRITAGAGTA